MIVKILGILCMLGVNFLSIVTLKESFFGADPKAGIASFLGSFIIIPITIIGIALLCYGYGFQNFKFFWWAATFPLCVLIHAIILMRG